MKQSIISRNRAQGVEGLYFSMRPMNSDELPKAASEYPQAFLTCEAMTASTEQYLNNVGVLARMVDSAAEDGQPYAEEYSKAAPLISALLGAHAAATAALDAVLQWFFGDDAEALAYFHDEADDAGGDDAAEITTDSGEN